MAFTSALKLSLLLPACFATVPQRSLRSLQGSGNGLLPALALSKLGHLAEEVFGVRDNTARVLETLSIGEWNKPQADVLKDLFRWKQDRGTRFLFDELKADWQAVSPSPEQSRKFDKLKSVIEDALRQSESLEKDLSNCEKDRLSKSSRVTLPGETPRLACDFRAAWDPRLRTKEEMERRWEQAVRFAKIWDYPADVSDNIIKGRDAGRELERKIFEIAHHLLSRDNECKVGDEFSGTTGDGEVGTVPLDYQHLFKRPKYFERLEQLKQDMKDGVPREAQSLLETLQNAARFTKTHKDKGVRAFAPEFEATAQKATENIKQLFKDAEVSKVTCDKYGFWR